MPAAVEFVDIAGLVAGASKGEGLGNKFLPISVRPMPSPMWCAASRTRTWSTSREKWIRPGIEIINTELALADLESVERAYQKALKAAKAADKEAVKLARRPGAGSGRPWNEGKPRAIAGAR